MNTKKKKPSRKDYKRAWYQKNKERIRESSRSKNRQSYYKHIEARRAKGRERTKMLWATKPDEMRRRSRKFSKVWREKNPELRKEYARKSFLKRFFNLTVEAHDAMLAAQGGVCAICQNPDRHTRLAVDHCHKTQRVRGLLCRTCNMALGKFGDDPEIMLKAIAYLQR